MEVLATLLLGAGIALAALLARQLPAALRQLGTRVASPAVAVLRDLHGGHPADSVTWLTIGAAGFGALLAAALR